MSDITLELESGKTATFKTAGKVCKDNIVVTASGSGGKVIIDDCYNLCYKNRRTNILSQIDTSNCPIFTFMLAQSDLLTSVPQFNTSKGTDFSYMFQACKSLTSVPQFNTGKGANFAGMFAGCSALTTIPQLDMSAGTDFSGMFSNCNSLTSVPQLNTSNGTDFAQMFVNCNSLTEILGVDLIKITDSSKLTGIVSSCPNLTVLNLFNIKTHLTIGSGTTYGHLLTVDSLVGIIRELIKVSSSKTLTMGAENLAKLDGLYCKVIDDTNAKLTMELCESTDEGAMTLEEYALLKKWTLK